MIPSKNRETRKTKVLKMSKNIQRIYKESNCRDCSVVVTRMDFGKILGKFNRVKIQYESSKPKAKKNNNLEASPNARLRNNENGMVLIHRNSYSQHPVKELMNSSKSKTINTSKENNKLKENLKTPKTYPVLKENNRLKKPAIIRNNDAKNKVALNSKLKQYGIIFTHPENNKNTIQNKLLLTELLPHISKDILPSEGWCIDYFPKDEEPKEDKVYDRIAAELEDLMYKEKPSTKSENVESKPDDFPSIMDILNDSSINNNVAKENNQPDYKTNLESSDVEAMLLGKSDDNKEEPVTAMEVDNPDESMLQLNQISKPLDVSQVDIIDNPNSPSILDETLQQGIEEQIPCNSTLKNVTQANNETENSSGTITKPHETALPSVPTNNNITHVIFKKTNDGKCLKSVTCPKNLKYNVELEGKVVEFLGAPKLITSLEDLQVLLQIVDETNLDCLYVLH